MEEKLEDLISRYEIRTQGIEKQFDEEMLKIDPKRVACFRPSKASILYGYEKCYEEVIRELKKLVQETTETGN